MNLLLWGMNYLTADLALREKLSWSENELAQVLLDLKSAPGIDEVLVLNTCNRTELYLVSADPEMARIALQAFLQNYLPLGLEHAQNPFYHKQGEAVVNHLFRVACGLDSHLQGESHILHQIKTAFAQAHTAKSNGKLLNTLFQRAIEAAKKIRSFWQTHRFSPSLDQQVLKLIAYFAVETTSLPILLVGAGRVNTGLVHTLRRKGFRNLTLINRTDSKSEWLAHALEIHYQPWQNLSQTCEQAEVIVVCTQANQILLDVPQFAQRKSEAPVLILDLAVPRNVSPEVGDLTAVKLMDIDQIHAFRQKGKPDFAIQQEWQIETEIRLSQEQTRFMAWYTQWETHDQMQSLAKELEALRQSILTHPKNQGLSAEACTELFLHKTLAQLAQRLKSQASLRPSESRFL